MHWQYVIVSEIIVKIAREGWRRHIHVHFRAKKNERARVGQKIQKIYDAAK